MDFPIEVTFKSSVNFQSTVVLSSGCVSNSNVSASAGIVASKLEHQYQPIYAQESATTAASEVRTLFIARGAGSLTSFNVGNIVACIGGATIVFDLKKNGTTVLSGTVTINNSHTARQQVAGTISSASFISGDVFELHITASAGGGTLGKGAFAQVKYTEAA